MHRMGAFARLRGRHPLCHSQSAWRLAMAAPSAVLGAAQGRGLTLVGQRAQLAELGGAQANALLQGYGALLLALLPGQAL